MREYLLFIAISILGQISGITSSFRQPPRRWRFADLIVAVLAAALVGLFALQLRIDAVVAHGQVPRLAWLDQLPLPVLTAPSSGTVVPPRVPSLQLEIIAALESAVLAGLLIVIARFTPTRYAALAVGFASASMLGLALAPHMLMSADMYLYVGYAKLGALAYVPPAQPFAGTFSTVNEVWGLPIEPSLYGPLWLGLVHVLLAPVGSLSLALHILQFVGALSFAVLIALLARLGLGPATLAVVAVNPMLIEQFVGNGHNDIWAVDASIAAFVLVSRRPLLAAAAVSAAGLVKLPMLLLGLLAFGGIGSLRRRLAYAVGAVAVCGFASIALGGIAYPEALVTYTAHDQVDLGSRIFRGIFATATLAIVALAFVGRRFPPAIWTFPMLGPNLFPWYLAWGFPYGVFVKGTLPFWLCALPIAAFAVNRDVLQIRIVTIEILVLAALAVLTFYRRFRFESQDSARTVAVTDQQRS